MYCGFCKGNSTCKSGECDVCGDYTSCLVETDYLSFYTMETTKSNVCAVCLFEKENLEVEDED